MPRHWPRVVCVNIVYSNMLGKINALQFQGYLSDIFCLRLANNYMTLVFNTIILRLKPGDIIWHTCCLTLP